MDHNLLFVLFIFTFPLLSFLMHSDMLLLQVERSDVDEAFRLFRVATQSAATDPRTGKIDMDLINTGRRFARTPPFPPSPVPGRNVSMLLLLLRFQLLFSHPLFLFPLLRVRLALFDSADQFMPRAGTMGWQRIVASAGAAAGGVAQGHARPARPRVHHVPGPAGPHQPEQRRGEQLLRAHSTSAPSAT